MCVNWNKSTNQLLLSSLFLSISLHSTVGFFISQLCMSTLDQSSFYKNYNSKFREAMSGSGSSVRIDNKEKSGNQHVEEGGDGYSNEDCMLMEESLGNLSLEKSSNTTPSRPLNTSSSSKMDSALKASMRMELEKKRKAEKVGFRYCFLWSCWLDFVLCIVFW